MHSCKKGGGSHRISQRRAKHWPCAPENPQAQAAFILTSLEVEVIHAGVRVSVCSVEADALQGRGYETEVALISYLHTQQVGVAELRGWLNLVYVVPL